MHRWNSVVRVFVTGQIFIEGHGLVDNLAFVLHCCSVATQSKLLGICLEIYHLIQNNRFAVWGL
jgi:hypothetical protein